MAIALVVLIAGVVATNLWTLSTDPPENLPDFPDGVPWICADPKCKAEFTMSSRELSKDKVASMTGQPLCRKCGGSRVLRAQRCRYCKRHWPYRRTASQPNGLPECPHCGEPVGDRRKPTTGRAR